MSKIELNEYRDMISNIISKIDFEYDYLNLVLGTTSVESDFGSIRRQHGFGLEGDPGGAYGINQVELPTHDWLINYSAVVVKDKKVKDFLNEIFNKDKSVEWNLIYNDEYNVLICILKYKSCKHRFDFPENPYILEEFGSDKEDIDNYIASLAKIWKKIYNTYLGKGKETDFISKFNKYVLNNK